LAFDVHDDVADIEPGFVGIGTPGNILYGEYGPLET